MLAHYLKQKEDDGEESVQQPKDTEADDEDEIPERKLRKKTKFKPRGPIGLLVAAMAMNGLHLGMGFEIREQNNPALKLLEVPWQMLKPLLNERIVRAIQRAAETTRTALHGIFEIDHSTLRKSLSLCRRGRSHFQIGGDVGNG